LPVEAFNRFDEGGSSSEGAAHVNSTYSSKIADLSLSLSTSAAEAPS
jgi:hypothetical protein